MQQYFTKQLCEIGKEIPLDKETLHHLKTVLRKTDGWIFRLADCNGHIFLCELQGDNAIVKEHTGEGNELCCDITVIMALVKSDKFEFALQKLTEMGVKRIVPYNAKRSVVQITKDSKYERFEKIVREAAEQSHRNIIPEITKVANLRDIKKYISRSNYIAYEKEETTFDQMTTGETVTLVIGPEGGFEPSELKQFEKLGFKSVSLGKRILRAETAAIFFTSLIVAKEL